MVQKSNQRASFLPTILPADPRAPESYVHTTLPLNYGPVGKLVFWLGTASKLGTRLNMHRSFRRMRAGIKGFPRCRAA